MSAPARDLRGTLADHAVHLKRTGDGEHRARCPRCAKPNEPAYKNTLCIKIDGEGGATWTCHRAGCHWSGNIPAPRQGRWPTPRPAKTGYNVTRFQPPRQPTAEQLERTGTALELWRQSESIPPGSRSWRYLVERRGITEWDDDRLRWHPRCRWGADQRECIVASIQSHETNLVVAVSRILPTMRSTVQRWTLGGFKGGASRLFWAPGPELAVVEGLEDALAYRAMTGVPTCAAHSAGNMRHLILPAEFVEVDVIADNDANGAGQEAGAALVERLRAEGRTATLLTFADCKDANDCLLGRRAAA